MRDKPHSNQRLDWPGGVVPDWARPQGENAGKRRHKGRGGGHGGHGGHGGPGGRHGGGGKRERLQKVMAQSGHGSRRNIEILIAQGHLTINGRVAVLGDLVGPGDKVKLDNRPIALRFGDLMPKVLLYHKPEGEIVTRDDPEGRATVFEKLPRVHNGRWVSVGRLDLNTGGLLLFTTNGELANRLMHPRFEVEREYAVRLLGELTEEAKAKLLAGIEIEGEACKFESIEDRGGEGANHWYHVVLKEGKNREVRNMCEAIGLTVSRLMRVRYGPIAMPSFLKRGMMRELDELEVEELLEFAGMREEAPPPEADAHAEEEEDDGQLKFLGRHGSDGTFGVPPGASGPGPRGSREARQGKGFGQGHGQRAGQEHGQRAGQEHGQRFSFGQDPGFGHGQDPGSGNERDHGSGHGAGPEQGPGQVPRHGKKNWKQRGKGDRGLQGRKLQVRNPQHVSPPQPESQPFQDGELPSDLQPGGEGQPPALPGMPPQGSARPAGHRGKRHRNRRGKGQRPPHSGPQGQPGLQGPHGQPGLQGAEGQPRAQESHGHPGSQESHGHPGSQESYGHPGSQESHGHPGSQESYGHQGPQDSHGSHGQPRSQGANQAAQQKSQPRDDEQPLSNENRRSW